MAQSRYEARQAAQVLQRSKATKPLSNQGIVAKPCGSKRSETPSAKVVKRSFGDQQPQALKAAQVAERRWLNQPTELDKKADAVQRSKAKKLKSHSNRSHQLSTSLFAPGAARCGPREQASEATTVTQQKVAQQSHEAPRTV